MCRYGSDAYRPARSALNGCSLGVSVTRTMEYISKRGESEVAVHEGSVIFAPHKYGCVVPVCM